MSRWQNFSIWRGRLPHWRADGVWYFVTFRHRRELDEDERAELFTAFVRQPASKWELAVLCVLPEVTNLIVSLPEQRSPGKNELEDIVERCKTKAGKAIVKASGERFPPFYSESYDRIVRDEAEMAERVGEIARSPYEAGLCTVEEEYRFLWSTWNPMEENDPFGQQTSP
ncbi:MAG: hypothetical protein JST30_11190 [Armatimonadetes bacterium]|nr:hypothetical protein [Armatimonadota bacterium]